MSEKDEDSADHIKTLNVEDMICEKLEKMIPGMIVNIKEQLKSKPSSPKSWNLPKDVETKLANAVCQIMNNHRREC